MTGVYVGDKVRCPNCLLWVTSLEGHFKAHSPRCGCHTPTLMLRIKRLLKRCDACRCWRGRLIAGGHCELHLNRITA
jgi:hypothetical protein